MIQVGDQVWIQTLATIDDDGNKILRQIWKEIQQQIDNRIDSIRFL